MDGSAQLIFTQEQTLIISVRIQKKFKHKQKSCCLAFPYSILVTNPVMIMDYSLDGFIKHLIKKIRSTRIWVFDSSRTD